MKKLLFIMMLMVICLLTGCYSTAEEVPLATKERMDNYVRAQYGEGKYVSETQGENSIEYIYKDEEFGFEYYVSSYAQAQGMDGSTFGYMEAKSSNFGDVYSEYVLEHIKEKIEQYRNEYGVRIEIDNEEFSRKIFPLIRITEKDNLITVVTKIGEEIKNIDSRDYFTMVYFSDIDDKLDLGYYDFNKNRYVSEDEEHKNYIEGYIKSSVSSKTKVEYVGMYKVPLKELGITLEDINNSYNEYTEDSLIRKYYFEIDGKEYYVADIRVNNDYLSNYDFKRHKGLSLEGILDSED